MCVVFCFVFLDGRSSGEAYECRSLPLAAAVPAPYHVREKSGGLFALVCACLSFAVVPDGWCALRVTTRLVVVRCGVLMVAVGAYGRCFLLVIWYVCGIYIPLFLHPCGIYCCSHKTPSKGGKLY